MKVIIRIIEVIIIGFMFWSIHMQGLPTYYYGYTILLILGIIAAKKLIKCFYNKAEEAYVEKHKEEWEEEERQRTELFKRLKERDEVCLNELITKMELEEYDIEVCRKVMKKVLSKNHPKYYDGKLTNEDMELIADCIINNKPVPVDENDYDYKGNTKMRGDKYTLQDYLEDKYNRDYERDHELYDDSYYYHSWIDDDD